MCTTQSYDIPFYYLLPQTIYVQSGIQHHLMVSFCACEHEAVTLLRMKLWPATPQQPSLAFQFELLDSYESLLLECQVALRDFVTSLEVNLPWYEKLQKDTVSCLFMHMHANDLCIQCIHGTCSAVPQTVPNYH